ncbi:MAG: hypothetical protein B7Z82_08070, partial [Halothiobacillus sp. 20-54-6]
MTYTGTGLVTIGGTVSNNNIETIVVHDAGLSGGVHSISYTEHTADTLTTIAAGLAAAANADISLQAIGVSATSSGAVITFTSHSVNVTTYTGSPTGSITITIGANTFGFLTKIDGPLAGTQDVTTLTYDGFNRVYTVSDSEGYTKTMNYDAMNRVTQILYPDGSTDQTTWDKLDAVLTKDRDGRVSTSSFDVMDQIAFTVDPLGRKTQYTWCSCGSLLVLTDPLNHSTSWQHDLQGRTISKTYPDNTVVSYVYDTYTSRVNSRTDALASAQVTNYSYYPDDKPYQTSYANAVNATATVTSAFDANFNRLTSAQKNDWGTISYTYNPYILPAGAPTTGGGRLQLVHNNVIANSDTTYTYDVLGRTTNRSINGASNSDTWSYDAMSRVTGESNVLGSFAYAYVDDVSGSSKGTTRLASVTYPNSQVTNYSWYPTVNDERLQQISNLKASGGATISQY